MNESKKYSVMLVGNDGNVKATYDFSNSFKGEFQETKALLEQNDPACRPLKAYLVNGDEKIALINGERNGALLVTPIELVVA